jgi:hypothetical protein
MKLKSGLVLFAALFATVAVARAADDVNLGTWKLNEAKSKISAGAAKNTKVVYEAAGDSVKVTVDGVDASGKATHNEWTGKYDGKDYAVTGDPSVDMRAVKKVGAHVMTLENKKDGKVVATGKITVAADGKSRSLTVTGADAAGKKVTSTFVYDKE